jgi:tRNA dimethylallyltransferase
MESQPNVPPLIAVVGETASGKSALALALAQQCKGEIIAADSRTVYTGMSIGTAKPTPEERQAIPHHLLDVASPDQRFTVADFKRLADEAITEIAGRGNIPFLVGGSGLYIDSILYDFQFRGEPDEGIRKQLQVMTIEQLHQLITARDLPMPENSRNPRHLIRVLEAGGIRDLRQPLRPNTLIIGLKIDQEALRSRVTHRVSAMVEQGFTDEVRTLAEQYGWDAPALQAPGYRAFHAYMEHAISLEEAKSLFVRNDMQLAKRQRTWFRRNKSIHWISQKEEAVDLITTFLNK